jgi:hypothetical protein
MSLPFARVSITPNLAIFTPFFHGFSWITFASLIQTVSQALNPKCIYIYLVLKPFSALLNDWLVEKMVGFITLFSSVSWSRSKFGYKNLLKNSL